MKKLRRIMSLTLCLVLLSLCVIPSASAATYYKQYTGTSRSIVDALKAVGVDSSFSHRAKIAVANGIVARVSDYRGTAAQNTALLKLLKAGTLKCPGSTSSTPASSNSTPAKSSSTKTIVFPVNNGMKIAYYYGYTKEYGGTHNGIDIHSTGDKTIYAAVSGKVVAIANNCSHWSYGGPCSHWKTYGNYVKILGDDGNYYYYGHLKQNSLLVSVNQRVSAGQKIATMGSSGWSTGLHLHFEVRSASGTVLNVNPATGSYKYQGSLFSYVNGPYAS